jgi:two-component system sensor histidine kinase ChiS
MEPEARILLIEDDPVTQNMMQSLLAGDGFGVEVVGEGIECISALEKDLPDIVLLDILLPDVSGLYVLTAIREKYSRAELPVIIVSGRVSSDAVVEGLKAGANDYVIKPIDFDTLIARIRVWVDVCGRYRSLSEQSGI